MTTDAIEVTEREARALLRGMQFHIQRARSIGLELWNGEEDGFLASLQPWVFGEQGRKFLELVTEAADGVRPITTGDFMNFFFIFRNTPYMHVGLTSGDEISEKLMYLIDDPEVRVIIKP